MTMTVEDFFAAMNAGLPAGVPAQPVTTEVEVTEAQVPETEETVDETTEVDEPEGVPVADEQPEDADRLTLVLNRKVLAHTLTTFKRIVGARQALPVLGNMKIVVEGGRVKLIATNLEITATRYLAGHSVSAGLTVGQGTAWLAPVATLQKAVAASKTPLVTLELTATEVAVDYHTRLPVLAAVSDFPNVGGEDRDGRKVSAIEEIFTIHPSSWDVAQRVSVATSSDEARPLLTAVSLEGENNKLRFVATDSYRLAVGDTGTYLAASLPEHKVNVPARLFKLWGQMMGAARARTQTSYLQVGEREVRLYLADSDEDNPGAAEGWDMVCRLIDGSFPKYRKLIPTDDIRGTLSARYEDWDRALRLVKAVDNGVNPVKVDITKDGIDLIANATDVGGTKTRLHSGVWNGDDHFTVAFNLKYLTDGIAAVTTGDPDEIISMDLIDPLKPALITNDGGGVIYLLMPVRI